MKILLENVPGILLLVLILSDNFKEKKKSLKIMTIILGLLIAANIGIKLVRG